MSEGHRRDRHDELEERVTRIETGLSNLASQVSDFITAAKEESRNRQEHDKEHAKWQRLVETRLAGVGRMTWKDAVVFLPLVVAIAMWVRGEINNVSATHTATETVLASRIEESAEQDEQARMVILERQDLLRELDAQARQALADDIQATRATIQEMHEAIRTLIVQQAAEGRRATRPTPDS